MAKLYGEILSSALMTFDKSFARANGQPLDSTEVYYSLEAAQTYAAGAGAYIGQKIVVVEDDLTRPQTNEAGEVITDDKGKTLYHKKVTHYGIEDAAGTLKELGAKPVGDAKSIVVAENGTISLKGVGTLVFERDIIGEDGQPTGNKEAIQYQPLMTAAGLVWVEPSKTTVEGLATLIEGLSARVKTIEDDYLKAADIANMATKSDVEGEANRAKGVEGELDTAVKAAQKKADDAYTLANGKLEAGTYATDKATLEQNIAAAKKAGDDAQATIDAFLTSQEVDETVNTLKEIQEELKNLGEAVDLEEQFAAKADKTTVEGIDTRVKAIEDAPYVKKSELDAVDGKFASYTNTEALTTLLAGKQDTIAENTYDAYGAAATAKQEALNTVAETYATKEALKATDDKATSNANSITNLTGRLDGIVAQGGEPNTINTIKVNGVAQTIDGEKAVDITVPTKFTEITDDSGFDARITAAQSKADQGVTDAAAAQTKANEAAQAAADNATAIGGLNTTVGGHTTTIGEHTTKITNLETFQTEHTALYNALKGTVDGHVTAIAGKAEQTALDAAVANIAKNTTAITTLNETTIPGINTEIGKKANAADVYTKTQIGTIAEGKTLVKMIEDAQTAATYDDTAVKALITAEETRAKAAEKANADEIARVNGVLVAALENDAEGLDSIKELADWISKHGTDAAEMTEAINANAADIAAINHETTGILAVAKGYTDAQIAAVPLATLVRGADNAVTTTKGLILPEANKFEMADGKVTKISVDLLADGENELILFGGTAK